MTHRAAWAKTTAILLSLPVFLGTIPFSSAEIFASAPLGDLVTSGHTTIGNTFVPTGTTIFAGDHVASDEPALIRFSSGGRVEIAKAAASFTRRDKTLVVNVDQGLLRFNFISGEEVQISAGEYRFNTIKDSVHRGELGLNHRGQIAMYITEGAFSALNIATNERTAIYPGNPLEVMEQSGRGRVSKNGQSLSDSLLSLKPDELRGRCIVAGGDAYPITGNTKTKININGSWKLKTGAYDYKIVECTEEAMIQAGAKQAAAKEAFTVSIFGGRPAQRSHARRNILIITGVGSAIAVPVAIKAVQGKDKSPSSN